MINNESIVTLTDRIGIDLLSLMLKYKRGDVTIKELDYGNKFILAMKEGLEILDNIIKMAPRNGLEPLTR
jgi:hypothetical protein